MWRLGSGEGKELEQGILLPLITLINCKADTGKIRKDEHLARLVTTCRIHPILRLLISVTKHKLLIDTASGRRSDGLAGHGGWRKRCGKR